MYLILIVHICYLHKHINYYNNENKLHILPKIKSINETKSMTHNIFMDVSNNVFGIGSNQYGQMGNNNNIPIYTQSVNYNNYNIKHLIYLIL